MGEQFFETLYVDGERVGCDGGASTSGGGPLGHPLVYLDLGKTGEAVCPYCSRHYVKRSKKSQAA